MANHTTLIDCQFCILEQFFPDGPDHPFALTMMKHFGKLGAPLYSIHEYPSLADQERRFTESGWAHAHARSLWDLWSDDEFVSSSLRASLDSVEVFDEWEEFALFASHYFLLHASTRSGPESSAVSPRYEMGNKSGEFKIIPNCSLPTSQRRFGALVFGDEGILGHHSGLGPQTRLADTDLYSTSKESTGTSIPFPPPRDVPARMCHTLTCFSDSGDCLLVGGRTSPAAALQDTWVRKNGAWRAESNLPVGRFRHCTTKVTVDGGCVLIYGGKTSDGTTLDTWLLWNDNGKGWQTVEINDPLTVPKPRFGACLGNINGTSGVLFGGIGTDGTILEDFWTWKLHKRSDGSIFLELADQTESMRKISPEYEVLPRFGATVTSASWGLVVAGGIIPRRIVPSHCEILLLDSSELLKCIESGSSIGTSVLSTIGLSSAFGGRRPLLVGHASCEVTPTQVLFLGGGAVCFSFGTFWTEGTWILTAADSSLENNWTVVRAENAQPAKATASESTKKRRPKPKNYKSTTKVAPIPQVKVETADGFQQILDKGQPVVIEGSEIGPCTELWTKDYLVNAVGSDRKVGCSHDLLSIPAPYSRRLPLTRDNIGGSPRSRNR